MGLDDRRARRLRDAGLAGVWLSVDDIDPALHDQRRGVVGTFERARRAARCCREQGLPLALSWVPLPGSVDRVALDAYDAMAAQWDAFAVRVIAPKAAGRWAGQEVALGASELASLERWYDDRYLRGRMTGPMLVVDTVLSERFGCLFRGIRGAYVDVAGDLRACPFCGGKAGTLGDYAGSVARLRQWACGASGRQPSREGVIHDPVEPRVRIPRCEHMRED